MLDYDYSSHLASSIMTSLAPFPDETVGSIAARYHLWSCNSRISKSLIDMFGTAGILPNAALPTRLGQFCKAIGGCDQEKTVAALISEHTLLRYFSFFGTREQIGPTVAAMVETSHPKATAGLLAGTFGAADVLKYCPACAKGDNEKYGTTYWHRSHQLPEVVLCSSHRVPLEEYSFSKKLRFRHALPLPPTPSFYQLALAFSNSETYRHQVKFAESSALLIVLDQAKINPKVINDAYKDMLISRGLARKSGRVDQASLRSELRAYYQDFSFLPNGNRLCSDGQSLNWLERIVRKPRTRQHPVLHLLLTNFLFSGPAEMLQYIGHTVSKERSVKSFEKENKEARIRKLLIDEGLSLRQTAKLLGKAVTTIKVEALSIGVTTDRRPKHISLEVETSILFELVQGNAVNAIADRYGVSPVSVYRVLRGNPSVKEERVKAARAIELDTRRLRFAQVLNTSRVSLESLKTLSARDYVWLWKNDRDWLTARLKEYERPRRRAHPRIDWSARDDALYQKVQKAISILLTSSEKPIRITLNEIGRQIGAISWLQKSLPNLPRTADLLATATETTYSFQARRVNWVIATKTGPFAPISTIARIAGIHDLDLVRHLLKIFLEAHETHGEHQTCLARV